MAPAETDQLARLRAALADRYEVDREIGHGGMACVYHARDRQHDRDVAIKVVRPELAVPMAAERFLSSIPTSFCCTTPEPQTRALRKQYQALVAAEGAALEFTADGIAEIRTSGSSSTGTRCGSGWRRS